MNMICNNGQSALHCLSAQVQMSRPLLGGVCGHSDEPREPMSVDDNLDQVFQLLVSAFSPLSPGETHTMQTFGLGDPDWISRVGSFSIIMPVPR